MLKLLRAWNQDAKSRPDDRYVSVCDGIRVLSIFMVVWFHIWQQSWLYPYLEIFGLRLNLDPLVRSGYIHVDTMILISGFCLFLPYARAEGRLQNPLTFYKKRLVRIAPSYYLTILIMTIVAVATNAYQYPPPTFAEDLISHLTFTQMFRIQTYYYTHMNAALWTIALEMQLYLLFPLLALGMKKFPLPTFLLGVAAGNFYRGMLLERGGDLTMYFNQLPAYIDVFIIGMMTAWLYEKTCHWPHNAFTRILCSVGTIAAVAVIVFICQDQSSMGISGRLQEGQVIHRIYMAMAGAALLLFAGNAGWCVRHVLGNPVLHFISGITMHIYIWNQAMAVWILKLRIVPSAFKDPNYEGDHLWQVRYTWLCFAVVFVMAVILTYGFEKPVARFLLRKRETPNRKMGEEDQGERH